MATTLSNQAFLKHFISANNLPNSYIETANTWFLPLIDTIATKQKNAKKQLLVGINGAQGSGKSTVSELVVDALAQLHNLKACTLSIDDFYKTHAERQQLAEDQHPLFATRGVPGTHDIDLALTTLGSLAADSGNVALPRFHKALDDRAPATEFDSIPAPVNVVILEGWCVGAKPQDSALLSAPVNELEANEDSQGSWRTAVNRELADNYQRLFDKIDQLIMLRAPSFGCVYQWRVEQEQRLRSKLEKAGKTTSALMSPSEIKRFIQFYQRLTEHQLRELPQHCDTVFQLDETRTITSMQERSN